MMSGILNKQNNLVFEYKHTYRFEQILRRIEMWQSLAEIFDTFTYGLDICLFPLRWHHLSMFECSIYGLFKLKKPTVFMCDALVIRK